MLTVVHPNTCGKLFKHGQLNRWALHGAIAAKYTAVPLLWADDYVTRFTHTKEKT